MAGTPQGSSAWDDTRGGAAGPRSRFGIGQFAIIQAAASSIGVQISLINLREAAEIERGEARGRDSMTIAGIGMKRLLAPRR